MPTPLEILKQYWGYDSFRSLQGEVVDSVLDGKDTVTLLHTGAGKSLCFQLPAVMLPGKTLVVSPLVALMQDQVSSLEKKGIYAKALYSGIGFRQVDLILDNFMNGSLKILYVSPERIQTDIFIERFKKTDVSLIAVDEAHCISQWGHDFRPSYMEIPELRKWKPDVPIIAVTATATNQVVDDICDKLELKSPVHYKSTFSRENLSLSVIMKEEKDEALYHVMDKIKGSGIIYVRSRKRVKFLAEKLQQAGISAAYYHGGLPMNSRTRIQKEWVENKTRIIVCTNAFGMGVDKPDVRFVIHMDIPPSLEEYYQEAGRGGRDGKMAYAISIIGYSDIVRLQKYHLLTFPELDYIKNVFNLLCSHLKIGFGSGAGETKEINLEEFSTQHRLKIGEVYSVLNILEKEGWLSLNESLKNPSKLLITSDKRNISLSTRNKDFKSKMLLYLLRRYEGIFIDYATIDEGAIANDLNTTIDNVQSELKILQREAIVAYQPTSDKPRIVFLMDRPAKDSFGIDKERYLNRKQIAYDKMIAIQNFMTLFTCREQAVLAYFDEQSTPCGRCDICKGSKEKTFTPEEKEGLFAHLKKVMKSSDSLPSEEYMKLWPFNKQNKAYACLLELQSEKLIRIDDNGMITFTKS